jgi:uncharacterized protein (TIGR00730 family)
MRTRKAGLAHRGDAYVVLPGGFGTLEELAEILVERQLGFHAKPLVLVNHRGFWDPLLALVDRQVRDGLVHESYRDLLTVVPDVAATLAALDEHARAPALLPTVDLAKLEGGASPTEREHG